MNGAVGITKGRQASITSTSRLIWQGRLLLCIPRDARCRWVTSTEPLPADFHRYALANCQSDASETVVVSQSPSLSPSVPPFNLHPCIPALLIFYSLLFPLLSLSLARSPLLSHVLGLFWLAPLSGRANARISFCPMKLESWQCASVLNLHKCRCNLIEKRVMESMSSGLDLVRRASSGQAPWGEKIKGAALFELKQRLLVEPFLSLSLFPSPSLSLSVCLSRPLSICVFCKLRTVCRYL